MAATEAYEYRPLMKGDGIRLFELQPSPNLADPPTGVLLDTALKICCEEVIDHFTALSYVWGDASDVTTITVEGKPLSITKTLETAMRYLRDTKRVMRVWADAICINQQDLVERGIQVKLMGTIYQAAHHTIIFLGGANKNTDWVFKWIHHPTALSDTSHGFLSQMIDPLLTLPWFYRVWVFQELILSSDPRVQWGDRRCPWDDFFRFFEAYYQITLASPPSKTPISPTILGATPSSSVRNAHIKFRAVIEQMQVARERYQMKSHQMKFDSSRKTLSRIVMDYDDDDDDSTSGREVQGYDDDDSITGTGVKDHEYRGILSNFIDIIASRRGFGVSDPRDMIFAHAGLVHNLNIGTPNYRKSIKQVFEDLAKHHIVSTKSYEIFSFVETAEPDKRRSGVPSWVPDWTQVNLGPPARIMQHVPCIYLSSPLARGFALASGTSLRSSRFYTDPWLEFPAHHKAQREDSDLDLFWTSGIITHFIKDLSDILEDSDIIPFEFKYKAGQSSQDGGWDETDYENAYLQWQHRLGLKSYMLPFQKGTVWQLWQPPIAAEFKTALQTQDFKAQSPAAHLIRCYHKSRPVTTIVHGRRLATLQALSVQPMEPVMALVPPNAQIGDCVCFLRACPVPFVLRKHLPENRETLDYKVLRMVDEDDAAQPRTRMKRKGTSVSMSSRRAATYGIDAEIEHFKLVGECFVEGLMYGVAKDIEKNKLYHRAKTIVLH